MQIAAAYRIRAAECRMLVKPAKTTERQAMLESLAMAWDLLASNRETELHIAQMAVAATTPAGK
jgi:hypothetical protein